MDRKYNIGDTFTLAATGCFYPGVQCIIVEVGDDGSYIKKLKAVTPDERLGKHGFILEDGEYYAVEWNWSQN